MHIGRVILSASLILAGLIAVLSCGFHTAQVRDEQGNVVKDSISELVKLKIGGYDQWLLIR